MKLVLILTLITFNVSADSNVRYWIKAKDLSQLTCEFTLNAFNVPECTRALTSCINHGMSRRINQTDEGQRFLNVFKECITDGFGNF